MSLTDDVITSMSNALSTLSKRPEVKLVPRCTICQTTENLGIVAGDYYCQMCAEECFG